MKIPNNIIDRLACERVVREAERQLVRANEILLYVTLLSVIFFFVVL